jgi:hypothetical protein
MQKTPTASALAAVLAMGFFFSAAPSKAQEEWQKQVAQALGKAGTASGGVCRAGLPRTDIRATLDGVELKPGFWANDDAKKLGQGLKAALSHINIAKS